MDTPPEKTGPLPVALSIAGSDSGGGAGIQADLKTFHQWGVFGTTAVTAVTAQDTTGVHAVHPIPAELVVRQVQVVCRDLAPAAVKTGMLHSRALVHAVAGALKESAIPSYVLDPVMVATSGDVLLEPGATQSILKELVPLATVVTPNAPEAALLLGQGVEDVEEQALAARALVAGGARAALVKGGHLEGPEVVDVLWDGASEHRFRHPRLETRHTHGTGCTLSAALTAGLALGLSLTEAAGRALAFVHRAIDTAPGLGEGHGPLNHFATP